MDMWTPQRKVAAVVFAVAASIALIALAMYLALMLFLALKFVGPGKAWTTSIVRYWIPYQDVPYLRRSLDIAVHSVALGHCAR